MTQATKDLIDSLQENVLQLQKIKKHREDTKALLNTLRAKGSQCTADPSVIKEGGTGVSVGALNRIWKSIDGRPPCSDNEGLTGNP